ncbi:MAG: TRAP transporter substrate-binding protein, partial [Eudoraea sp.]|nr:TRAP transporter substrate-binding protein [Eudoraea sp.]
MKYLIKNNRAQRAFSLLAIVLIALVAGSCTVNKNNKTLYFAHSLPTSHPVHKGILVMQEALNKKSGGKLQIKIFPDGQLGSEREALELLQIGSIAITKVSA